MLTPKKLIKMVRKWQKVSALGRRRIMSKNSDTSATADSPSSLVASKGHVFMYTTDGKRFMVPLKYLTSSIFRELLRMSEEEFGLPTDGPIMLPCEAACMDYIISLLHSRVPREVERAVLASIASSRCTTALAPEGLNQQLVLYGFWKSHFQVGSVHCILTLEILILIISAIKSNFGYCNFRAIKLHSMRDWFITDLPCSIKHERWLIQRGDDEPFLRDCWP